MWYPHKYGWFFRFLFPSFLWRKANNEKKIYLTFDDGPVPEATEYVLEELAKHNIKATFFCVGDNIRKYPTIFQRLIEEGHAVGNHTFNHINGAKYSVEDYCANIALCQTQINTQSDRQLFRPPYGRIKNKQANALQQQGYTIVMWDVLSADFVPSMTVERCLKNTVKHTESGSIVLFHDRIKNLDLLKEVLPKYIEACISKGYSFAKL